MNPNMTTTQKTERAEAIESLRKNYHVRAGSTGKVGL
jgi:hypothetical protein